MRLRRRPAPDRVVTLVTRQGCHLCEVVRPGVAAVAADAGARFELRDVDSDPADLARWGEKVPVVLVDGVEHGWGRVDQPALRRALRRTRRG